MKQCNMTKEEAIKILRSDELRNLADYYSTTQLQDMIDTIVSAPPLPSNLDEAAQKVEDYYDVGEEHGYLCCHRGDIKAAFKAGAEWMAGKFQKIDGSLVDWYETYGVEYCHGISTNESFEVPEGFYIRKK